MTALPTPALMWQPLARNPYGEAVEENAAGARRVYTESGWQPEAELLPWRACRALAVEDVQLAIRSLADPWVSEAFRHDVRLAYAIWRRKVGQPALSLSQVLADPGWPGFERAVAHARGLRVLHAWLRHRPQAPEVPRWEGVLAAPSDTAVRALQWGLARHLEAWAQASPELEFLELGLVDAADAATARLAGRRRQIHAAQAVRAWGPEAALVQTGFPAWPGASGAFGKKAAPAWPTHRVPVVWATPASLRRHGSVADGWPAIARQARGVVVLSTGGDASIGRALADALKARGRVPSRWRLPEGWEVWRWGWEASAHDERLDWAAFAPLEQPQQSQQGPADAWTLEEKVPYRALSRLAPPEGVASRALEASMHAALLDYSRTHPGVDVDRQVADALGHSVEALGERLGPEQIDAVALALEALAHGKGFLVSDETGFGKGRTLASLALAGLRQGKTVVFVTENPFLFSDFYRDIEVVSAQGLPQPTLLHKSAWVKTPSGKTVGKSLKPAEFSNLLKRKEWHEGEDRFILTTYAQLGRAHAEGKVRWLKDRMGPGQGWLLLDEVHNAAGDSNVGKHIEELVKHAAGTVFASATYAKHEANLALYRPVLDLPPSAQRLLKLALADDDGLLREVLTQQMARSGRLMRREHAPVDPPQPLWVALTPERQAAVAAFSEAWRAVFRAARTAVVAMGLRENLVWMHLGAALARSVRECLLQVKGDALVEFVLAKLQEDKKVVVTVESTLEAALREALTPVDPVHVGEETEEELVLRDEESATARKRLEKMVRSGDGPPPLWRDRIRAVLESVTGEVHDLEAPVREDYDRAIAAIAALPDWDLAPLDRVRQAIEATGVATGELSGRQTQLKRTATGWVVQPREDLERNELVRAFNAGKIDVVFITRAGCAGISLHAGRQFSDRRVRCLVEWDVALNPVNRVQFLGRVRRKDQVVEPEFYGLVMDTPEDRRIMQREERKRRKLKAHAGARETQAVDWLSELGESIVAEWAQDRPALAYELGVAYPVPDMPTGRVDRAMIRSLVLPPAERAALIGRLERGVALGSQVHTLSRQDPVQRSSRALRSGWWWGDPQASLGDPARALATQRLDLVERIWRPEPGAAPEVVAQALSQAPALRGQDVLSAWVRAWTAEHRQGVMTTRGRKQVADWVRQHLPALDPGQAVWIAHPVTQRRAAALVLGWEVPSSEALGGWSATQVAVQLWLVGETEPTTWSVRQLMENPHFKPMGRAGTPDWFRQPPLPWRGLSLEGHPVQAAAWGRRWGWGRSALVRDEDAGPQVVWWLPAHLDWDKAWALPRDLVDVEHALLFWRAYPDVALAAALPMGLRLSAQPVAGGLRLAMDAPTLAHAQAHWMPPPLERLLRLGHDPRHPGVIATVQPLPWKAVPRVLHSMAAGGVGWRVAAKYATWYAQTAPERTRARQG